MKEMRIFPSMHEPHHSLQSPHTSLNDGSGIQCGFRPKQSYRLVRVAQPKELS